VSPARIGGHVARCSTRSRGRSARSTTSSNRTSPCG
jgi:hypothetical protein